MYNTVGEIQICVNQKKSWVKTIIYHIFLLILKEEIVYYTI